MAVGDVWGNPTDPFDWWCEFFYAGVYANLRKFNGADLRIKKDELEAWAKLRGYVRIVPAKKRKKARKT